MKIDVQEPTAEHDGTVTITVSRTEYDFLVSEAEDLEFDVRGYIEYLFVLAQVSKARERG